MLRRATEDDIPALGRIYIEALQETYRGILPESYLSGLTLAEGEATWARILQKPEQEVLVDQQDGAVAGLVSYKPDGERSGCLNLASLYVDRRSQGRGVGRRLIRTVWERAREMGYEAVSVGVVQDNLRARGLYERLGAVYQNDCEYRFGPYPVICRCYVWPLAAVLPAGGAAEAGRQGPSGSPCLPHGRGWPAARYRRYHSSRVSRKVQDWRMSSRRDAFAVPVTSCICAGWRRIHAAATAVAGTWY